MGIRQRPVVHPFDGGREIGGSSSPVSRKLIDFDEIVEAQAFAGQEDEGRLRWLASQIIGIDAEMVSPFGSRRITYCDHTASGRFLRFIEEFLTARVLPYYGNTHTQDSYVGLHTGELVKQANLYIKRCVGAGPNIALLFCGSGATGAIKRLQEVMGTAAPPPLRRRLLDSLLPHERWVVFLGPYEHHSNLLSWRQSLGEVVEIGLNDHGKLDLVALEEALLSPKYIGRPKLGSFSACSNVTGVRTDTRAVATLLHRHGAYACFDFACSGPYDEIDMRTGKADGYDAIFLSPHKFLGGPGSPGILLMNDALYFLQDGPPSTCGGGTVLYVNGHDEQETLYNDQVEEREDAGTPPIVQKLRAALAFAVKSYAGHDLIHRQEAAMWQRASSRLSANPRIRILGENNGDNQPIFSFLVYPPVDDFNGKHLHCHFTSLLLNDLFGIQSRGGCACAGPYGHHLLGISRKQSLDILAAMCKGYEGLRPGFTRVSFAYYTSTEEMEFVLDAIEFVAEHGHRFLPLYHFDWRTGAWNFTSRDGILSPSVKPLTAALRRCRAAIRRLVQVYECRASCLAVRANLDCYGTLRERNCGASSASPPPFAEYLRMAREMAKALPHCEAERTPLPTDVDPQSVSFIV